MLQPSRWKLDHLFWWHFQLFLLTEGQHISEQQSEDSNLLSDVTDLWSQHFSTFYPSIVLNPIVPPAPLICSLAAQVTMIKWPSGGTYITPHHWQRLSPVNIGQIHLEIYTNTFGKLDIYIQFTIWTHTSYDLEKNMIKWSIQMYHQSYIFRQVQSPV